MKITFAVTYNRRSACINKSLQRTALPADAELSGGGKRTHPNDMRFLIVLIFALAFVNFSSGQNHVQTSSCPLVFHDSGYLGDRPLVRTATLNLGEFGQFDIKLKVPADNESSKASATFISNGRSLLKLIFKYSWSRGWVDASASNLAGWPSPLIFVVASSMRADGVSTDAAIVTFNDGRFRRLFPRDIFTDANNAICLTGKNNTKQPFLRLIAYTEGDYGEVVWPKYYKITSYSWTGRSFKLLGSKDSKRKHQDWASAAEEFGIQCDVEVLSTTLNQP